jgi:hypothetical protein
VLNGPGQHQRHVDDHSTDDSQASARLLPWFHMHNATMAAQYDAKCTLSIMLRTLLSICYSIRAAR